mgnify:CR=1 FL=1
MFERKNVTDAKRLWPFAILVFILLISLSHNAMAAGVRIGFIDIQKSVASTKEFKRVFTQFRSKFQKEKVLIAEREKKVKAMLDRITQQSLTLKAAEKKKKEEEFLQQKKSFERYVQDKNEEFQRNEKEITDNILRKMLEVLKKIGKERKYTMILEKKAVFYSDTASDLTSVATKAYDRIHK